MNLVRFACTALALAASMVAHANPENATSAEAQERLKAVISAIKAQGAGAGAKALMGADDPAKCRFKDVVCMVADVKASALVMHSAIPKLVGSPLVDDLLDIDGVSINQQLFGPAKQGKVKWETKYKFARPDTKKIVGRSAFCEKADDAHVVCVSVSN